MNMYCYQCQETAGGEACQVKGVCGKTDDTANLQDLLLFNLKGIAWLQQKNGEAFDETTEDTLIEGLFSTVTNTNFNADDFRRRITAALDLKRRLREGTDLHDAPEAVTWDHSGGDFPVVASAGVMSTENDDLRSLRELLIYGVKGIAAYYHHAAVLGRRDTDILTFICRALAATLDDESDSNRMTALVLECGQNGVAVMKLLDGANTAAYGHPEPTDVDLGVRPRPGILVSGHDLKDLDELLQQTDGSGVDVYTHGEMLPAQYYPAFKKYGHFAGNYGGSWYKQAGEFEAFNGPILMTTNCIVPPRDSYKKRIFTTGVAGYAGVTHLPDRQPGQMKNFSPLITLAQQSAPPTELERGTTRGGFAHSYVLSIADQLLDAVKSGAIKRFVVMAGCDGRQKGRQYYTDFAQTLPADTVILTAGCAKYRYNKLDLGDIGGIPRVLDAGQCNDSYSLAVIALKLAQTLGVEINELPIVYNIAWYEQKAVIVLLALLHLGVKNIKLGPTLPAFLSPGVTDVLVKSFNLSGIQDVDADTEELLGELS